MTALSETYLLLKINKKRPTNKTYKHQKGPSATRNAEILTCLVLPSCHF